MVLPPLDGHFRHRTRRGHGALWFEGSAYRVLPVPNLDLRYQRDKIFISARDGVRATLLDLEQFQGRTDPALPFPALQMGRPGLSGTGRALHHRGGGCLRYDLPFPLRQGRLRRGLGGSEKAAVIDALVDGKARLDSVFPVRWPAPVGHRRHPIGPISASAPPSRPPSYAQYYPGAGLRSVGVGTSVLWRLNDKVERRGLRRLQYLADVAGNSPLVSGPAGSRNQFIVGAAISGAFPGDGRSCGGVAVDVGQQVVGPLLILDHVCRCRSSSGFGRLVPRPTVVGTAATGQSMLESQRRPARSARRHCG